MPSEHSNFPNSVKYSIWDTRINENQLSIKEKFTGSVKRADFKSKPTDHQS